MVGNGEQVETIAGRLVAGDSPAGAGQDIDYEPDLPICTPRTSAVLSLTDDRGKVTAARRPPARRATSDVLTLSVRGLEPGDGILLSTYRSDGVEIATRAEPVAVGIPDDNLDGVAQVCGTRCHRGAGSRWPCSPRRGWSHPASSMRELMARQFLKSTRD